MGYAIVQGMSSQRSQLAWGQQGSSDTPHTLRVMDDGASLELGSSSALTPTCWPACSLLLRLLATLSGMPFSLTLWPSEADTALLLL